MTPAQFWDIEMQNQRANQRLAVEANLANQEQRRQMIGSIGEALGALAGAYQQKEQDKSDAKIYGNLLKFMAPAFGQQGDAMLKEYSSLKSDRDKANFGRTAASMLGPMSNAMMAQGRMGIQQQGQALTAAMPGLRNQANAAAQVAAGQGTYVGLPPNVNPDAIITE